MKTCPYCAEAIQEDSQFCQFCGTNLGCSTMAAVSSTAALVAIILCLLSYSEIGKSVGRIRGRGLTLAGLILGYFGVAFIPFILIIAAIAIPNLLRAKIAANEASAVGSLRNYQAAMGEYASKCPK